MKTTTKTNVQNSAPLEPAESDVLARYGVLAAALSETSVSIPEALAEEARLYADLGAAEIAGDNVATLRGKLDAVREHREAAVRMRAATADGLVKLEPELFEARRAADEARSGLAGAAISELQREWTQTVERLAEIHGRVQVFQQVMRTQVRFAAPYKATLDLQGQPTLQFIGASAPAAALPVSLQSLTDLVDRLDVAGGLASAIRTSRERDAHHYQLALSRRAPGAMPGVYTCRKPVSHWGATFAPGTLIDQTIICVSSLYRLQVAHSIMLATDRAVAA